VNRKQGAAIFDRSLVSLRLVLRNAQPNERTDNTSDRASDSEARQQRDKYKRRRQSHTESSHDRPRESSIDPLHFGLHVQFGWRLVEASDLATESAPSVTPW